ncbi:MAG: MlaD family protein [Chitinophagaceae bacterium]|nr:MlaD family protein [Chitinophagaceae bacterium]
MKQKAWNNIKLGVFVLAGLLLLIAGLYLIGKDTNLFSRNYILRAQFSNVEGLVVGNNVRYSGIQVGTVKEVKFLSDTLIEVRMVVEEDMQSIIRKDDIASVGTDGLMGNKIINIAPGRTGAPLAVENDLLRTEEGNSTEAMLAKLALTNNNLLEISNELKKTVQNINTSRNLWRLLNDESLPASVLESLANIRRATEKAQATVADLQTIVADVKAGKGTVGQLLRDTAMAVSLADAVKGIRQLENRADTLATQLSELVTTLDNDLATGKGPVPAALHDSLMVQKVHSILSRVDTSAARFNENMEAMKHNFLFRGYFKKQEKEKQKQAQAPQQ